MKKKTAWRILDIALNLAAFCMVALCVASFFWRGGDGNMQVAGFTAFRYYTVDSNVLFALTALLAAIVQCASLKSGKLLPKWVIVLKFTGTIVVTVTFLTVIVFLGPLFGFGMMYDGVSLYLHGIVPVIALFSLLALERGTFFSRKEALFSLIPTLLYGVVYFLMTVWLTPHRWEDFYGFNRGGFWYVTAIIMVAAAALLAMIVRALYVGKRGKRHEKED